MTKKKKVFVSGCFDLLHSGHIAFFEEASTHGDVYVGLGSDKTIFYLKNRKTAFNEQERLYMVKALKFVKDAWINTGSGYLDFAEDIKKLNPDIFFVNEDGDSKSKRLFCEETGVSYVISKRVPKDKLPQRSTTHARASSVIPFRLDVAGGWLDQPYVSKYASGPVLTISIHPKVEFANRSGMSSSTRNKAIEIWGYKIPSDDPEKLAKLLFRYENPPGKKEISGSQDSIGIVMDGLNRLNYTGDYWPESIESVKDEDTLSWIEQHLHFLPLFPRHEGYNVLKNKHINTENAELLADAADNTWKAILNKDSKAFGENFRKSYEAQIKMFPNMLNPEISETINKYKDKALGWKLSGAGGGGYLVLVSEEKIPGTFQISIRTE